MNGGVRYVPVLCGKAGEIRALRLLPAAIRNQIWPVLDVPPVRTEDDGNGGRRPTKPLVGRIESLVQSVGQVTRNDRRITVDLLGLHPFDANGAHPIEFYAERAVLGAAEAELSVRTDAPDEYIDAVTAAAHRFGLGVCLRARAHPSIPPGELAESVRGLTARVGISSAQSHLMIDLERASTWGTERRPNDVARDHLNAFDDLDAFRLVSVASTGVPDYFEITRDDPPQRFQRREWVAWRRLRRQGGFLPVFADYGITGPRPDTPPFSRSATPNLRYTTDTALLIWKAASPENADDGDLVTFADICRDLAEHDDFDGTFSEGDAAIAAMLRDHKNEGSPTRWIEWATSHHLTLVVKALQQDAAQSGATRTAQPAPGVPTLPGPPPAPAA